MKFYETDENKEKSNKKEQEKINETNKTEGQEKVAEENNQEEIKEEQTKEEENKIENVSINKKSDEEIKQEIIDNNNKRHKKFVLSIIVPASIILILLILGTFFALLNINNTKMISGISIDGTQLKGMSREEALILTEEKKQERLDKPIILKVNDFEYSLTGTQLEVNYKIEEAIEEAYNVGRSSNIFVNNYNILKALLFGKNIVSEISYNEESLQKILDDMAGKLPEALIETEYYREEDKLIIAKGKAGNTINKEEIKEIILHKIKNNNFDIEQINVIHSEPSQIDIQKIHDEVYTEPKDAYFTTDPFQIYPHVDGIDFDIEKAKEILKEEKEEYEIPLTITTPKITTNQIGTEAFPNLLSSFSTKYDASLTGRSKNLRLAAEKIDGTVVMPGEIFSYNKTVGKRTVAGGYTEAAGYAGGKVVQTLGGGICQISSTLYDAAVYANLEIIERINHMFITSYIGAGKDATVVYGAIDFKFKNTRKYPIKIQSSVKNGIAKMEIYGIKEETEYEVEISTEILGSIPYKTIYEDDSSLASGEEKVVQKGMNGIRSRTYKILKLNGVEVSSTVLSNDTYDAMNKIVKRGTANSTIIVEQPEPITPTEPEPITPTEPDPITPTEPDPVVPTEPDPEPTPEPIIPPVDSGVVNSMV